MRGRRPNDACHVSLGVVLRKGVVLRVTCELATPGTGGFLRALPQQSDALLAFRSGGGLGGVRWRAQRAPGFGFLIGKRCNIQELFFFIREPRTRHGVGDGRAIGRPNYPTVRPERQQRIGCCLGERPQAPARSGGG